MDFKLSREQILLQQTVAEFTRKEIEPRAGEMDRAGRLPDDLLQKMADINLTGMTLPKEYGGNGSGNLDCVLAIEQIGYSGTAAWWLIAFTNSIPECISEFGADDQKNTYLKPVCDGVIYPGIQFTEAGTGSDPNILETTARPDGGHYILNGTKRFSTFGARPGYAIVYAKDENETCTAFIADKSAVGYSTGPLYELMGGGGVETVDVYMKNLKVTEKNILGEKGAGLNILQYWIALEKIQQCGACVGIAQAALDEAKHFAASRMVRGKPLSGMLNIRTMIAEIYSLLQAARWLTYRAAFLKDAGSPDWMTEAAAAKVFVVPAAMNAVEISRRIHGAYGYTREYKIERLYRAIAGASAIAVSLEINKSIVASSLLK